MNTKFFRIVLGFCLLVIVCFTLYKIPSNLDGLKALLVTWYAWLNAQNPMIAGTNNR